MLGETSLKNNNATRFVTVKAPPVGVKTGDWITLTYTFTGLPAGTPYPEWYRAEFLSVTGTNATVQTTLHMSNGTEQTETISVDVMDGGFDLVIPANSTAGNIIYISGYGNVSIVGETTRTYAEGSRTVVYANISQWGTQLTYYWDKLTGILVEAYVISGGVTATIKATETNLWQVDDTPPTIGIPSRTPSGDILPNQEVTIAVNATDNLTGVKNVTLSYTINDEPTWTNLPMNYNSSTGLYEATIPPQPAQTWVKYKIVAYDNAGNNATLDGTLPYCTYQVIPEFPSFLVLPLFIIATLLAVIVYRRRKHSM